MAKNGPLPPLAIPGAAKAASASAADEARFRVLVEAFPSGLIMVDRQGRLKLANGQMERLFGHPRAAMLGQPVEMLMPERFRGHHAQLRTRFMGETGSRAMGLGRELFGLRRDGSEFPIEIGLNPITWDGEPMVLAAILDVTQRQKEAQAQERARRDLERSNADLEEFAYVASHDLKAPLRAVAHLAQWISEDMEESADAQTQENLALLRQRVTRLQTLLDGLLAYARIGRIRQQAERVDTAEVVEEIAASLGPPEGFSIRCATAMPVMMTARSPLEHVLLNLVVNALKHHDRGQGEIRISAARRGAEVEFSVEDDGPGIDPKFHDRIFVIFQTLASRDEVEASGIGLAIVKKTVERHGGRIAVHSAPPARGARFVFTWLENSV